MSEYVHEPKKLSAEELERSIARLTRVTREEVVLKPLAPTTTISQEDLDKRIKHLYDDSIARRAQELEDIARQRDASIWKDSKQTTQATISPEDEEMMVKRLYDDSIERKELKMQELYEHSIAHCKRTEKKFTPAQESEITDRLYREGMERERNKRIAGYQKYVLDRRGPQPRRTRAQLAASADKMTKGEGVTS